jgi:hypothetical protein
MRNLPSFYRPDPDNLLENERPDFRPASLIDEVYTPSLPALRRATRPTWGSLSEPRREQNLSANPKRTAKFNSYYYYDV